MAIITLEISPELEQQLHDEAAKQGLEMSHYILNTLQRRLHPRAPTTHSLSKAESELLEQINLGLPSDTWEHYHALLPKRRAETLTDEEQGTLIQISDRIEQANVRRMQALIELAALRGKSLAEVMQDLGIWAPKNG